MNPKQYLNLALRWWWVIVAGVVIGAIGGFVYSRFQDQIYESSTKILIMQSLENQASTVLTQSEQEFGTTFLELLVTRPIVQATAEKLGYSVSTSQINVSTVGAAQMIEVTAQDEDPQRAADIANTLVSTFLAQYDTIQSSRYTSSEENIQAQIQQVESQTTDLQGQLSSTSEKSVNDRIAVVNDVISGLQKEISDLEAEIVTSQYRTDLVQGYTASGLSMMVTPTATLDDLVTLTHNQTRLDELKSMLASYQKIYTDLSAAVDSGTISGGADVDKIQSALNLYQQIYSNLLSNYEAIRLARLQSTPNVVQVEEAVPARKPIQPNVERNILLGTIVGLVLSGAGIFVRELLDESIRDAETVSEALDLPVLGYIGEMNAKKGTLSGAYVIDEPRSPISEAFRSLRNNLDFVALDKPMKSILISSSGIGEGKTTIAANLALVMAQAGKHVVLVDADLRRPRVHDQLKLPNNSGLSDVMREYATIAEVAQTLEGTTLDVITSGALPPNPAEVLGSDRMAAVIKELENAYDVVILDGVPYVLADATILAGRVSGVLIVIRLRATPLSLAIEMVEQFERAGGNLVGVVLNHVLDRNGSAYSYALKGYSNYGYYIDPDKEKE